MYLANTYWAMGNRHSGHSSGPRKIAVNKTDFKKIDKICPCRSHILERVRRADYSTPLMVACLSSFLGDEDFHHLDQFPPPQNYGKLLMTNQYLFNELIGERLLSQNFLCSSQNINTHSALQKGQTTHGGSHYHLLICLHPTLGNLGSKCFPLLS